MPQFDLSTFSSQLFWLISFFVFLYMVVSKFLAPRLETLISNRGQIIEDNINLAQKYNDQIKAIELYKANLQAEIAASIENIRSNQQKIFDTDWAKKQEVINNRIKQLELNSQKDIQKYTELFMRDEPEYCLQLSQVIIKKVTNKETDIKILEKLYDRNHQ